MTKRINSVKKAQGFCSKYYLICGFFILGLGLWVEGGEGGLEGILGFKIFRFIFYKILERMLHLKNLGVNMYMYKNYCKVKKT